eukprot:2622006-Prymnesium_polylepis.1
MHFHYRNAHPWIDPRLAWIDPAGIDPVWDWIDPAAACAQQMSSRSCVRRAQSQMVRVHLER